MEQETIGSAQNGALSGIRHEDVLCAIALFVPDLGEDADQPDLVLDGHVRLTNEKECVLAHGLAQGGPVGLAERGRRINAAHRHSDALRKSI